MIGNLYENHFYIFTADCTVKWLLFNEIIAGFGEELAGYKA